MDAMKIEGDYDCKDTDNKFENLPERERQKWANYLADVKAQNKDAHTEEPKKNST